MSNAKFKTEINKIIEKDRRYPADAYEFVSGAVTFTVKALQKENKKSRHITGKELLGGMSRHALEQFGPLAGEVLRSWGLVSGPAVGDVVFNLVNQGLLSASESDSPRDFDVEFDFGAVFVTPFQPGARKRKSRKTPIIL
jgi:uncharacterized repeat protein (TIGR04138 family)